MIRVQNIYYMLAYAFQVLQEQGYKDVAQEKFENAEELLAAILCKGISTQIKRGLGRQYIPQEESLTSPRGRIELGASIITQAIRKKQLICTYDDFSVNAYANQILKTTMELLLKADISPSRKKALKKLLVYFGEVTVLDPHRIRWNLQYDRNSQTYRMLIAICHLIIKGLLQTNREGTARMMDYLDEQTMPRLYERFILCYFKREHPELKTWSPQIPWQLDDDFRVMLPAMQSDIVLQNRQGTKTLIIDAKYYSRNTQQKAPYMAQTVHSGNLYQIFTYVKNWKAAPGETVSGMLLYARTEADIQPNQDYQMSGNRISVKTLDLDCDFSVIKAQLDEIAHSMA